MKIYFSSFLYHLLMLLLASADQGRPALEEVIVNDFSRSVALDCGHFLQAQKPTEVAAELTSFFASEGRRTRSFHIPHEAEEASPSTASGSTIAEAASFPTCDPSFCCSKAPWIEGAP